MIFDPFGLKVGDLIGFKSLDEITQFVNTLLESGVPISYGRGGNLLGSLLGDIRYEFPMCLYLSDEGRDYYYLLQSPHDLETAAECVKSLTKYPLANQYWFSELSEKLPYEEPSPIDVIDFLKCEEEFKCSP